MNVLEEQLRELDEWVNGLGNKPLKESLNDWTDSDLAGFALAVCLGLMPNDIKVFNGKAKHVFWSNNPLGNLLGQFLYRLGKLGVLETDDDSRFRWNNNFKGDWEN